MFRVVIDATPVTPRPSGVGFHIGNLIAALAAMQGPEAFRLGLSYQPSLKQWLRRDRSVPPALVAHGERDGDVRCIPLPVRLTNALNAVPGLAGGYFERSLDYPDILHGTNFSVYPRKTARTLLTLYDLTFLRYPQYVDGVARRYGDRIWQYLQWTDRILTISEHSKRDIVELLGVAPERVHVTYLASRYASAMLEQGATVAPEWTDARPGLVFPPPGLAAPPGLTAPPSGLAYDFSQSYILFVSTLEPRKNVTGLIAAFDHLKRTEAVPHHLVLVGRRGWNAEPIFEAMARSPWAQQIHHLDYLDDAAVEYLYRHAAVFAFPSHYEGFGLPVLEAMALGVPVVTSNTSSLPEVAGDAAVLVDPAEPESIAAGLAAVVGDAQRRAELIQRGFAQVQKFSWRATALGTVQAYRALLS
jgi:glycosyltransferase involved in cell wall biosynthesis